MLVRFPPGVPGHAATDLVDLIAACPDDYRPVYDALGGCLYLRGPLGGVTAFPDGVPGGKCSWQPGLRTFTVTVNGRDYPARFTSREDETGVVMHSPGSLALEAGRRRQNRFDSLMAVAAIVALVLSAFSCAFGARLLFG